MTYAEKLRDPRWQRKRNSILERDNYTCVHCGETTKHLQVHHILYLKRDPWDYQDYLLQTLCVDCHELRGELTEKAVNALRIALGKTPNKRLLEVAKKLCAEAMLEIEVDS